MSHHSRLPSERYPVLRSRTWSKTHNPTPDPTPVAQTPTREMTQYAYQAQVNDMQRRYIPLSVIQDMLSDVIIKGSKNSRRIVRKRVKRKVHRTKTGARYVLRKSKLTGKQYKQYLR